MALSANALVVRQLVLNIVILVGHGRLRPLQTSQLVMLAICCFCLMAGDASGVANTSTVLPGIRTVALNEDALPGVETDVRVEQFSFPRLNKSGSVAFKARLLRNSGGVDFDNDTAIWSELAPNDLAFVAREGSKVQGLDYTFDEVEPGEDVRMSASGDIYFLAGISAASDPTNRSSGLFQFSQSGDFLIRAVSSSVGDASIPATSPSPGTFFSNFHDSNEVGELAFQTGSGFGTLWTLNDTDGLVQLPSGSFPHINDLGDVAYRVGDRFSRKIAVREKQSGTNRTVAMEGALAPETDGASFFELVTAESGYDNTNSGVIFVGRLTGTEISEANDFGVWSESSPGGAVELILREGENAPGTEEGVTWAGFNRFSLPTTFGRSGGLAIRLELQGPEVDESNNSGVWAGTNRSDLHLVVREGDQAPGTEPGIVFSQFSQAAVTSDGRGVFFAFLEGDGLDADRDRGIWAEDLDGSLKLIARRGDMLPLPSGEITQITSVGFSPERSVSEQGHIGFLSNLADDRRGIFVSSVVAVPEPTTACLLGCCCILCLRKVGRPI